MTEYKIFDLNDKEIWAIFEQLLEDNKDVLERLKTKENYTIEDFLKSRN